LSDVMTATPPEFSGPGVFRARLVILTQVAPTPLRVGYAVRTPFSRFADPE